MNEKNIGSRRQIIYWHILKRLFDARENTNLDDMAVQITNEAGLPEILLDDKVSIDNVCQRYPDLKDEFLKLASHEEKQIDEDKDVQIKRGILFGKLINNVFGSFSSYGTVSAQEYADWCNDVRFFENAHGLEDGDIRGKNARHELTPDFKVIEDDMIKRMHIREILADDDLASKLSPGIGLVEQLLRDKSNLDSKALKNAKMLIKKYVDQVAEVLKTQVEQASTGKTDKSVPPRKTFRNLDLKRTIWKNLQNWNPEEEKLYVDQLFYKHTGKKNTLPNFIVVVDQSGSMVDSMVNCAILASVFSNLHSVNTSLIVFDTRAVDLSKWVHDPFEVLMRTNLGGGNNGMVAMQLAATKIECPEKTAMVWISDFYEFDKSQGLFNMIKSVKESGVKFIPVGSVTSSGYQSVNPWFKKRFKELGTPVISGNIKKLIWELKNFIT